MSLNKVILCGNLTRDPEVRTTASGSQVMSFSIAVNDRAKNPQTGAWEDKPNYIDCAIFGSQQSGRVEFFSKNLAKGSKVALEGRLRWSQWEAKDGSGKRSKLDVIVDELELMSRTEQAAAPAAPAVPAYTPVAVDAYYEEPLPF